MWPSRGFFFCPRSFKSQPLATESVGRRGSARLLTSSRRGGRPLMGRAAPAERISLGPKVCPSPTPISRRNKENST
jgi:hypothetical protein